MTDSSDATASRGRALTRSPEFNDAGQSATGFQRAAGAFRTVVPHLLRLLPLLDGNVGSVVSNLLSPPQPAPPPAPPINLAPIEEGLAELQEEHRNLRTQVSEQSASVDRIEGRLQTLEEDVDRNTLAQQEVLKELKALGARVAELKAAGHKANVFTLVALSLLALIIIANAVLSLRFYHFLP